MSDLAPTAGALEERVEERIDAGDPAGMRAALEPPHSWPRRRARGPAAWSPRPAVCTGY